MEKGHLDEAGVAPLPAEVTNTGDVAALGIDELGEHHDSVEASLEDFIHQATRAFTEAPKDWSLRTDPVKRAGSESSAPRPASSDAVTRVTSSPQVPERAQPVPVQPTPARPEPATGPVSAPVVTVDTGQIFDVDDADHLLAPAEPSGSGTVVTAIPNFDDEVFDSGEPDAEDLVVADTSPHQRPPVARPTVEERRPARSPRAVSPRATLGPFAPMPAPGSAPQTGASKGASAALVIEPTALRPVRQDATVITAVPEHAAPAPVVIAPVPAPAPASAAARPTPRRTTDRVQHLPPPGAPLQLAAEPPRAVAEAPRVPMRTLPVVLGAFVGGALLVLVLVKLVGQPPAAGSANDPGASASAPSLAGPSAAIASPAPVVTPLAGSPTAARSGARGAPTVTPLPVAAAVERTAEAQPAPRHAQGGRHHLGPSRVGPGRTPRGASVAPPAAPGKRAAPAGDSFDEDLAPPPRAAPRPAAPSPTPAPSNRPSNPSKKSGSDGWVDPFAG